MLTPADLDALEQLERKATPIEWMVLGEGGVSMNGVRDAYRIEGPHNGAGWPRIARVAAPKRTEREFDDFNLIVTARNALPDLIRLARIGMAAEQAKERGA